MVRQAKNSVVLLCDGGGVGSGFVISRMGHVMTCSHVVEGQEIEAVSPVGHRAMMSVFARDQLCDLAILQGEAVETNPMCFADPASIAEGQTVFALGHPLGLEFTVSRGVVSCRERILNGISYVQTDAPLNSGNSGGPVVNQRGEVIGIANFGILQMQRHGFAVAVRHALSFASQVRVPVQMATTFRFADADPDSSAEPR